MENNTKKQEWYAQTISNSLDVISTLFLFAHFKTCQLKPINVRNKKVLCQIPWFPFAVPGLLAVALNGGSTGSFLAVLIGARLAITVETGLTSAEWVGGDGTTCDTSSFCCFLTSTCVAQPSTWITWTPPLFLEPVGNAGPRNIRCDVVLRGVTGRWVNGLFILELSGARFRNIRQWGESSQRYVLWSGRWCRVNTVADWGAWEVLRLGCCNQLCVYRVVDRCLRLSRMASLLAFSARCLILLYWLCFPRGFLWSLSNLGSYSLQGESLFENETVSGIDKCGVFWILLLGGGVVGGWLQTVVKNNILFWSADLH